MTRAYSVLSFAYWKAYAVHLRPYLLFVSGIAGMLGAFSHPIPDPWRAGLGALAFFLSYGLGQALTDVFQTDTDAISSPYRPLTQGLISKKQVFITSLVGLSACLAFLLFFNPWIAIPGIAAVIGLVSYTPLKKRWWGGPIWNSWIVALLPIMGRMLFPEADLMTLIDAPFGMILLSVFFSYAVFVHTGYLKDVSADRACGYNTHAVRFGWKSNLLISFVYSLLACAASAVFIVWRRSSLAAFHFAIIVALWSAAVCLFIAAHVWLAQHEDEKTAHFGIAMALRAFIILHLAELAAYAPAMLPYCLSYYLAFELVMQKRPERSQL